MSAPDVVTAVTPVVEAFEHLRIPYHVGGSVASSAHGFARATLDVDLVADIDLTKIQALVNLLQLTFYIDEGAIRDAVQHHSSFNLIHLATMLKVDIFIPKGRPYDHQAFQRARKEKLDEAEGAREFLLASPEDIILNKLEWYRQGGETSERQWADVLGVLKVQSESLDFSYLRFWANELRILDLLERGFQDAGLANPSASPDY